MKNKILHAFFVAAGLVAAVALFINLPVPLSGASSPGEYVFDVAAGHVTIEKDGPSTLKVQYGNSLQKSNIPLSSSITLVSQDNDGNPSSTSNSVIVDGSGISGNIKITLDNIFLKSSAPMLFKNGADVSLSLLGTSTIESDAASGAAIELRGSSGITIQAASTGSGSLHAIAGSASSVGIGSRLSSPQTGGVITLNSGNVKVTVGSKSLGIGAVLLTGSSGATGGNITINGGMLDIQTGSSGLALGTYFADSALGGTGGNITIKGGTIAAASGIGNGNGNPNASLGSITIDGGSFLTSLSAGQQAFRSSGKDKLYLYTLFTQSKNNRISGAVIDEKPATTSPANATGVVYGINDVQTSEEGKLYFWLPASTSSSVVGVQATDNYYQNHFVREQKNSSITLYPNASVAFDLQGGSIEGNSTLETISVPYGDLIPTEKRPPTPVKDSYTFGGWHTGSDFTDENAFDLEKDHITSSITLYARWVAIPVSSITVTLDNAVLVLGKSGTAQATAAIAPENATNRELIWSSDKPDIATVNDSGTITAKAPGSATITATAADGSSVAGQASITVIRLVESVTINAPSTRIKVGESLTATAAVSPIDASNKKIIWTSSDEKIATVKDGVITGVSPGNVVITATSEEGTKSATLTLTVTVVLPSSVKISSPSGTDVPLRGTLALSASVLPETAADKGIIWSSGDIGIATVDAGGTVTGIKEGTVTITATSKAAFETGTPPSDQITLRIKTIKVNGITLNNTAANLLVGSSLQMKATVVPINAAQKEVSWVSSDASVASVDANGLIKAIKEGKASITATAKDGSGIKAGIEITVQKSTSPPPVSVFRVMYDVNWGGHGTSMIEDQTGYLSGASVTLRTVIPTRTGYSFVSWNTKADGSGTTYKPGAVVSITQDIRLYAQWKSKGNVPQPVTSSGIPSSSSGASSSLSQSSSVPPLPVTSFTLPSGGAVVGRAFTLMHAQDGATGRTGWEWDSSYFDASFEGESAVFTPLKGGESTISYTNPEGIFTTVEIQIAEAPPSGLPVWLIVSLCVLGAAAAGMVVLVLVRAKRYRRTHDEYQG